MGIIQYEPNYSVEDSIHRRGDEEIVVTESSLSRRVTNTLSTHHIMSFVILALIFVVAAQPVTDTDFWWHLRTGQYIVDTKTIPHTDIFSTVRFGSEWVTHEWLAEVLTYLLFRAWSFGGLIIVFSLIITAAYWIAYRQCRRRTGHVYFAGFALLLGAFASMPTWGVRPHVFSLLFASIFISFLDRYSRREEMPSIWWLAPLMILWVNLHAGFALGIALIVITLAGLMLNRLLLRDESIAGDWQRLRSLCWVLIVCVGLVSLNPNFTRMYSYPFETLTSRAMMQYIQEWRSPNFYDPRFQALALLMLSTFSALAVSSKRVRPSELLMLVVTAWATLRSARNVPYFALVAMPLLAEHSWNWVTGYRLSKWLNVPEKPRRAEGPSFKVVPNAFLGILVLILVVLGVRRAAARQHSVEVEDFPAAAVNFIQSQRPLQPIFNEYDWGGYLIWRLYPDYRVYIDGRADVFGDQILEEFLHAHDGKPGWREFLDSHGIRTVLVKPDVPLASLLRLDSDWHKVFEDKRAAIFVR